MNTASFVRRTSSPRVAQAAWLSRMAASRRPNAPRRSASTPIATRANTIPQSTAKASLLTNDTPKTSRRPTVTGPAP